MLCSRLEYLQNLPTNLSNVHQMEELKILSYIQPWAFESCDNFGVFNQAVSLIPANTQVDYFTKIESLDACLSFIQEIQQPPAVVGTLFTLTFRLSCFSFSLDPSVSTLTSQQAQ
jgi:hypothetical protein